MAVLWLPDFFFPCKPDWTENATLLQHRNEERLLQLYYLFLIIYFEKDIIFKLFKIIHYLSPLLPYFYLE